MTSLSLSLYLNIRKTNSKTNSKKHLNHHQRKQRKNIAPYLEHMLLNSKTVENRGLSNMSPKAITHPAIYRDKKNAKTLLNMFLKALIPKAKGRSKTNITADTTRKNGKSYMYLRTVISQRKERTRINILLRTKSINSRKTQIITKDNRKKDIPLIDDTKNT